MPARKTANAPNLKHANAKIANAANVAAKPVVIIANAHRAKIVKTAKVANHALKSKAKTALNAKNVYLKSKLMHYRGV